jgi:hypothetical protein
LTQADLDKFRTLLARMDEIEDQPSLTGTVKAPGNPIDG